MYSATEQVLVSRYSQITNSYAPKGVKECWAIYLQPQHSYIKQQFLVHYADNKLHIRCLYDEVHAKYLIASYAIINTPLATKDFRLEFHAQFIDYVRITAVHVSPPGQKQAMFVMLTNEVDYYLYRIPLSYFYYQTGPSNEISTFVFSYKANELHILTRSADNYKSISLVRPLTQDYLVGYDRKLSSLCLMNYSDSAQQIQRFKHENQQFYKLLDPAAILVDSRGLQLSKASGSIQGVLQGRNSVILVHYQHCAIEIWEYYMARYGGIALREQAPPNYITSKFNYLKALYPAHLIPQSYSSEHSFNVLSVYQINYRPQKSADEHFFFVAAIRFRGERNPQYKASNERYMDQSLIASVPDQVFIENNIFLYSAKKFLCAANVDFTPDIISISQCYKYIFAASTHRNLVASFRIDSEKSGFILSTCKTIFYPNRGACLTQVISTPKWICMIDALDQVYCYNQERADDTVVDLYCAEEFGVLHLPKDYSAAEQRPSLLNTAELNRSLTKSVHFDDESGRRKVMTRIPNLHNYMNTSLFSPRTENYVRQYSQAPFAVRKIYTFDDIASSLLPHDEMLSAQQVREVQEKFTYYYNIYEKMRVIEEYLILCINVETSDAQFQHLNADIVLYAKYNADNIRISQNNANFDFGSTEFLYNEIQYINPKLIDFLSPIKLECAIDFSMLDSIRTFFNTRSLPTRYLDHLHLLLDMQLGYIHVSEAQVCDIIQDEIYGQPAENVSLDCLLSNKITAMMEYLRLCALHYHGGFAAIQQAISSQHSSIQNYSQEPTVDYSLDVNDVEISSPQQLSEKIVKYAKRTENVLKDSEKALLSDQQVLNRLPNARDVRDGDNQRSTLRDQESTYNYQEDFDFAKLQNIYSIQQIENPIISQDDYRFIRKTMYQGETVDYIYYQLYLVTDNDRKSRADEIQIIELQVRDEDAPDDGNYVIEKVEEIYYEETISDESYYQEDGAYDLTLNEAQMQSRNLDIKLLERQVPASVKPKEIEIVIDKDIERYSTNAGQSDELKVESLDYQAPPLAQQSDLHSVVSYPDEKYSETVKRQVLNYVRMELKNSDALRYQIENKSKLAQDSAVEKVAHGIYKYKLIKNLNMDSRQLEEVVRIVLRLPPKEQKQLKDRVLNASKLRSSITEENLDSAAFLMDSQARSAVIDEKLRDPAYQNPKDVATSKNGSEYANAAKSKPSAQQKVAGKSPVAKSPKSADRSPKKAEKEQKTKLQVNAYESGAKNKPPKPRDAAQTESEASHNTAAAQQNLNNGVDSAQQEDDLGKLGAFDAVAQASNLPDAHGADKDSNYMCSTVKADISTVRELGHYENSLDEVQYTAFVVDPAASYPVEPYKFYKLEQSTEMQIAELLVIAPEQPQENTAATQDSVIFAPEEATEIKAPDSYKQIVSDVASGYNAYKHLEKLPEAYETAQNEAKTKTESKSAAQFPTYAYMRQEASVSLYDSGAKNCQAEQTRIAASDVTPIEETGNKAQHDVQVARFEEHVVDSLTADSIELYSVSAADQNGSGVRLRDYAADVFYPCNQSELLSPNAPGYYVPYFSPPAHRSFASAMLNSTDAQMFDRHIDREALLRDLSNQNNLYYFVDELIRLQEGANRFFETAFIHQKRQNGFRYHIMQIRDGKLPRNEIIAQCVNYRQRPNK